MSKLVPNRELLRLEGLYTKVGRLLDNNKFDDLLLEDIKSLETALKNAIEKLAELNAEDIALNNIESRETRHDIRNLVGIAKGYAELIKDITEHDTKIHNLLDKILLWSSKTITTLERKKIAPSSEPAPINDEHFNAVALDNSEGNILILDDESSNRELLSRYIKQLGLTPHACKDAAEAYTTLENQRIDLILLDLMMPEVSGHDVLNTLKNSEIWRAIPVIVISGLSEENEVIRCIQAGADDYLQKPFNKTLLQARLYAGLARKQWVDKERLLTAELEKSHQFIRNTFGRYLSNEIVANLLEKPDGLDMGGQLQTVTILMADIRSFTTICESLEPQKVVSLLNNYLGTMADVILKHSGTVDEFIGDAILALFGAPVAKADDTDRAISCALEMQAEIEHINTLNREAGLPEIKIGISLNTGQVIAGNIGSNKRAKYGVVGHSVNVTSRIEDKTRGGEILASRATLDNTSLDLKLGREIQLQPKGVSETIEVHAIKAINPAAEKKKIS